MRSFLFLICCFLTCAFAEAETNQIIATDNGLEMFHWDLDFVREAKESIEISAGLFGGEIARKLLSAIETRLEQVSELQVFLLTSPILLEKEDWQIIERLRQRFPRNFHIEHASTVVVIWPDVSGIDNHVKMIIVDEKYFSAGGTNLDESQCSEGTWTPEKSYNKLPVISNNLPAAMRDQDIVGKGPLATTLRHNFYKMYALWEYYNQTGRLEKDPEKFRGKTRYFPVDNQAHVERFELSSQTRTINNPQIKVYIGGPHQKQNEISQEYIRLIESARDEIILSHLYFCPVDPIFNALLAAVNRGVKLTVLTNGVSEIAPQYTQYFCWANRMNYVPMFYGNTYHFWDVWSLASKPVKKTRIYEYHVADVVLHKKVMIVDGRKAIVGSYNLGTRSEIGDYEMIFSIDSPELAADLKKIHEKDIRYSREVSPQEARDWYFDPVKSYLGEIQKRFHGLI